jgi:hypothetical protein
MRILIDSGMITDELALATKVATIIMVLYA